MYLTLIHKKEDVEKQNGPELLTKPKSKRSERSMDSDLVGILRDGLDF